MKVTLVNKNNIAVEQTAVLILVHEDAAFGPHLTFETNTTSARLFMDLKTIREVRNWCDLVIKDHEGD